MSRGIPGRVVQVTAGVHMGKQGFAYNRDQEPAIIKAGKVAVWVPLVVQAALFAEMQDSTWKKVLFEPGKLKVIGFID